MFRVLAPLEEWDAAQIALTSDIRLNQRSRSAKLERLERVRRGETEETPAPAEEERVRFSTSTLERDSAKPETPNKAVRSAFREAGAATPQKRASWTQWVAKWAPRAVAAAWAVVMLKRLLMPRPRRRRIGA